MFVKSLDLEAQKLISKGISNKDKYLHDMSYFSTFMINTDEMKIYRRPRVEMYSFKTNICQTIYFMTFKDAQFYGELKAKENNLIKYE